MDFWSELIAEAVADNTLYVVTGLLATYALVRSLAPEERPRLLMTLYMVGLHVALVPVVAYLHMEEAPLYKEVRLATLILAAVAGLGMMVSLVFSVILPKLHLHTPRILHDVIFVAVSVIAIFMVAGHLGFDISGLIATSAVLTAVVGFSLQGTLGNIIAGLAMQMDDSMDVGDWVQFDDVIGRVTEMRWRYTALETRDWERVLIPNSNLVGGRVALLGKRAGEPIDKWRRKIEFHVDYYHAPSKVIQCIDDALIAARLPYVATDPAPHVLLSELDESYGQYVVRYWLMDIEKEDRIESLIRTRIYFALKRQRIRLALPTEHVFITDAPSRKQEGQRRHIDYKQQFIKGMDLFDQFSDEECAKLAEALRYAPFSRDEHLMTQGQKSHELYILTKGKCSVRVSSGGEEREVATLHPPDFFGEMSLMTGEARSATIIAQTDIETYRLDKEAFERFIKAHPEVAEQVAVVLAKRQMTLESVIEDLDSAHSSKDMEARSWEFLKKIQKFFNI